MANRPLKHAKPKPTPGELDKRQARAKQIEEQRRHEMATRSTLSRLRNRKSDLK